MEAELQTNREVLSFTNLPEDEIVRIAQSSNNHSSRAKEFLLKKYEPLCKSYSNKYTFQYCNQKDSMQFAKLGLLLAINNFKPGIASLGSYARFYIKKEVINFLTYDSKHYIKCLPEASVSNNENLRFSLDQYPDERSNLFGYSLELKEEISELMDILTPLQKSIFQQYFVSNRKSAEIQKEFDISRQRLSELVKIIKSKASIKLSYLFN